MNTEDLHQCRNEGRAAFQTRGVTGFNRHNHPTQSMQRQAFIDGHDQARFEAAERSQCDAAAYHALSARHNAKDRAWAAKPSQA